LNQSIELRNIWDYTAAATLDRASATRDLGLSPVGGLPARLAQPTHVACVAEWAGSMARDRGNRGHNDVLTGTTFQLTVQDKKGIISERGTWGARMWVPLTLALTVDGRRQEGDATWWSARRELDGGGYVRFPMVCGLPWTPR
jgi:hypothetical protein